MQINAHAARCEMTGTAANGSGPNKTRMASVGDARRRVINALETFRVAAQFGGDIPALLLAEGLMAQIASPDCH